MVVTRLIDFIEIAEIERRLGQAFASFHAWLSRLLHARDWQFKACRFHSRDSEIRIWQQNDEPGQKWAAQIPEFIPKTCRHTIAAVPEKFPDVNDWTRAGASVNDLLRAIEGKKRKPKIIVRSPSEILAYEPPPGIVLVGDNHITRGSVFVIGGAPGVGKSRASVALAKPVQLNAIGSGSRSKFTSKP
jgi:hypothetical protein